VNTADARLSIFDLTTPAAPQLIREIPVGIEPVSVQAVSDDEAWVVNQVSDSVSVVSVSRGIVVDTLRAKNEPADVVFVGNRAFVTLGRSNTVRVFDVTTHAPIATIPLEGENSRAIASSPDGRHVYVAFALSGNRTTVIPAGVAPPPPAPTNPNLPPAPPQALIVDSADSNWRHVVPYTVADHDVAEIDTSTLSVSRYFTGVGTINMGLAVRPTTGDLFVANTEARNVVRFEPNLRGHLVDNRVTRVTVANGRAVPFDRIPPWTTRRSRIPRREPSRWRSPRPWYSSPTGAASTWRHSARTGSPDSTCTATSSIGSTSARSRRPVAPPTRGTSAGHAGSPFTPASRTSTC
jgi:YVTN family beta-propeller protein